MICGDIRTGTPASATASEEEAADYADPETACAEDAVAAVIYAIRMSAEKDVRNAAWAAQCAYEAMDAYVTNQAASERRAHGAQAVAPGDPLIQAELRRQEDDLRELRTLVTLNAMNLKHIKERAAQAGGRIFGAP